MGEEHLRRWPAVSHGIRPSSRRSPASSIRFPGRASSHGRGTSFPASYSLGGARFARGVRRLFARVVPPLRFAFALAFLPLTLPPPTFGDHHMRSFRFLIPLFALQATAAFAQFPKFEAQEIDPKIGNTTCYAVTVADINGD